MTGFDLGSFPDQILHLATTMVILSQDSGFEVAGEINAYSITIVAFLNEKCVPLSN